MPVFLARLALGELPCLLRVFKDGKTAESASFAPACAPSQTVAVAPANVVKHTGCSRKGFLLPHRPQGRLLLRPHLLTLRDRNSNTLGDMEVLNTMVVVLPEIGNSPATNSGDSIAPRPRLYPV